MGSVEKYAAGAFGSRVWSIGRVPQLYMMVDSVRSAKFMATFSSEIWGR